MKYISTTFLVLLAILFVGCSQKEQVPLNKDLKSISLDKNIAVAGVPKTVKSPVSIGLGLGGYISKHVGIHVGTTVRPDIKNTDALNLQKGIAKYNLSLSHMIKEEFSNQMRNDSFYKNRFVPFGANYTVHLFVKKYEMDSSIITFKSYPEIFLELKVLNQNDDVVYSNIEVNSIGWDDAKYTQREIFSNKQTLIEVLDGSIKNVISKLIEEMKKN